MVKRVELIVMMRFQNTQNDSNQIIPHRFGPQSEKNLLLREVRDLQKLLLRSAILLPLVHTKKSIAAGDDLVTTRFGTELVGVEFCGEVSDVFV